MKLQCLYYALDRINDEGGYIVFRKSTHWLMPHVLHFSTKTRQLTHYVPPDNLNYPWQSMFGFAGVIKVGDDEVCEPMSPLCVLLGTMALWVFGALWLLRRGEIRRRISSLPGDSNEY
jgi:hypothetical protein